jgi:hypothetical protein
VPDITPVFFNLKTSLTATKTKGFVIIFGFFISLSYQFSCPCVVFEELKQKQDGGCHVPDITPVNFNLKTSLTATKTKGFVIIF